MSNLSLFLILGLVATSFAIQHYLNSKVKERYIDEQFHLKMSEQYIVQGNFKDWDPAITTPPGLYWSAYIYAVGLKLVT